MSDLAFNFEAAKQIAKQAGFSGVWYRQRNGRWRLPVDEDSGLEWSPTRSKLRIYGPDAKRAGLPLLVEKAVKSNLIASPGPRGLGEDDREIIRPKAISLNGVDYMASGETSEYRKPLVEAAEEIISAVLETEDGDHLVSLVMWSNRPILGSSFA